MVFTDICMPGLGGLELAVRLRDACPTAKTVFVTAHAGYAVEAFAIHAQGYVLKPLTAERVREELAALPPPKGGCQPCSWRDRAAVRPMFRIF